MSKMQISAEKIKVAIDYYNNLEEKDYDALLSEYVGNQPVLAEVTLSIPEDVKISEDAEDKMADLSIVIWKAVKLTFPDFEAIDEKILYAMQDAKNNAYDSVYNRLQKELGLTSEKLQDIIEEINQIVADGENLEAIEDIEHSEVIIKALDTTNGTTQEELTTFVNEMLDASEELDENEKSMIYSVLEVVIASYDNVINS